MFHSLRSRMIAILLVVFFVPVLLLGFFLVAEVEHALYQEKENKLFSIARILDNHFQDSYNALLARQDLLSASRQDKIKFLNQQLRSYTDEVANSNSGIGVGYYDQELDAIITYGPSKIYQDKVGLAISASHNGRKVMETAQPMIQNGDLVRGNIMNAMVPITRQSQVIGYIWANELTQDIENQLFTIKRYIYGTIACSLAVGILVVVYVVNQLIDDIEKIKGGVLHLRENLNYPIIEPNSEVGEIAEAINLVARDIAAQQRLEEQVLRTEQLAAVGEMAAGMAHEIRNPLMSIKGFAELIQEECDDKFKSYVEIIIRESQKISRLTEKLMCLSKPLAIETNMVDVNIVLLDAIDIIYNEARHKSIVIEHHLTHNLPDIFINREQLEQVFINLLMNAIQAIHTAGQINISSFYDSLQKKINIVVADNGCGIEPENIGKIFNPFYTTKEKGTGLGLAVVYQQVERWQGKINVDSTVGRGSVFTIVLPGEETNEL